MQKVTVPPEAIEGLGRMVEHLFEMLNDATTLPEGLEAEEAAITFEWNETGQTFRLTLKEED